MKVIEKAKEILGFESAEEKVLKELIADAKRMNEYYEKRADEEYTKKVTLKRALRNLKN